MKNSTAIIFGIIAATVLCLTFHDSKAGNSTTTIVKTDIFVNSENTLYRHIILAEPFTDELAKKIVPAIRAAKHQTIILHIMSIGGFVNPYYNIAEALSSHSGKSVAVIHSFAYSAAAALAAQTDTIILLSRAELMYHLIGFTSHSGHTVRATPNTVKQKEVVAYVERFILELDPARCFMTTNQWTNLMDGQDIFLIIFTPEILVPGCKGPAVTIPRLVMAEGERFFQSYLRDLITKEVPAHDT